MVTRTDPLGRFRQCTHCGYDLRARVDVECCPECGKEYAGELTIRQHVNPRRLPILLILGIIYLPVAGVVVAMINVNLTVFDCIVIFIVPFAVLVGDVIKRLARLRIRRDPHIVISDSDVHDSTAITWRSVPLNRIVRFEVRRHARRRKNESDDRPRTYSLTLDRHARSSRDDLEGVSVVFLATEAEVRALRAELGRRFSEAHQADDA